MGCPYKAISLRQERVILIPLPNQGSWGRRRCSNRLFKIKTILFDLRQVPNIPHTWQRKRAYATEPKKGSHLSSRGFGSYQSEWPSSRYAKYYHQSENFS